MDIFLLPSYLFLYLPITSKDQLVKTIPKHFCCSPYLFSSLSCSFKVESFGVVSVTVPPLKDVLCRAFTNVIAVMTRKQVHLFGQWQRGKGVYFSNLLWILNRLSNITKHFSSLDWRKNIVKTLPEAKFLHVVNATDCQCDERSTEISCSLYIQAFEINK